MANFLEDRALQDGLVTAGFEQIKKFTWKNSAEQLLGIYANMLDVA